MLSFVGLVRSSQRMHGLQKGMEDLSSKLHSLETHKTKWPNITDIVLDQLPQHLHELKVCFHLLSIFLSINYSKHKFS